MLKLFMNFLVMIMKNIVIVGASSGIGMRMSTIYAERGCKLTVCARRLEKLQEFAERYKGLATAEVLDVDSPDAVNRFQKILAEAGDVDIIINCAGIGKYNPDLDVATDLKTIKTDCVGFTAIADAAFNYFASSGRPGQFAAISSIAGVRGIGVSISYSAAKRFQTTYLEGLDQLRRIRDINLSITDIRPGFAATDLLDSKRKYPMLMSADYVARLAVKTIDKKRRVSVIDWRYNILVGLWRLIPRWLWVRLPIKLTI